MLIFFDFLYYSIWKLYIEGKDNSPEFAASCAIAGLQSFNIISVMMLYRIIMGDEINISKLFAGILIVSLIILNYIRYIWIDKFNYETIKAKLETKPPKYIKRNRQFQIIYLIVTILLFFGLISYFASKKM